MFGKKLILPATLAVLSLTGCVITTSPVAPTGAGDKTGASTPTAGNKDQANKAVVEVMVSQPTMVIQTKKASKVMATVKYADGSSDSNVTLVSDDATIVAVNGTNGEISGVKPGTATVRAQSSVDATKFGLVTVTVKEGEVVDVLATIDPEKATIKKGETVQLSASIQTSAGKTSPNGSWTSSNSTVAIVNGDGLVTGVKDGSATITFTSDEKSTVKATAVITVGAPAPAATPAPVQQQTTSTTTTKVETASTTN
ncbi:MAG: Ig-like domain-containing protein [Candidatus Sericytochromatia bacterium]|nr:Ig-like domain-containing protein [Candidatus Sericytochromatia bacterium]